MVGCEADESDVSLYRLQWVLVARSRESQMINCSVPQRRRKCAEISCTRDWTGVGWTWTPAELHVTECCHVPCHCIVFHVDWTTDIGGVPASRIKQLSRPATQRTQPTASYLSQLGARRLVIKRSSREVAGLKVVQGHSERYDLTSTRVTPALWSSVIASTQTITSTKLHLSLGQVWCVADN